MLKDFVNIKGDIVENKQTLPIKYGEQVAKIVILVINLLTSIPIIRLLQYDYIGKMHYYFYLSTVFYAIGFVWFYFNTNIVRYFYTLVKILIAIGVFAIVFIR